MEINLTHEDFVAMATDYVSKMGITTTGKSIDISASVGRKEKRITATVSILDATPSASIPEPVKAPVEPVNEPEEEVEQTPSSLFK